MNEKGQTLIEVVLALAAIGLIVTGIYMSLNISLRATGIVNERTTAESLTRSELESIKNCEYDYWRYDAVNGSTLPDYGNGTVRPVADFSGYNISSIAVPINGSTHELLFNPEPPHSPLLDPPEQDHGIQLITVSVYSHNKLVLTTEDYKVKR